MKSPALLLHRRPVGWRVGGAHAGQNAVAFSANNAGLGGGFALNFDGVSTYVDLPYVMNDSVAGRIEISAYSEDYSTNNKDLWATDGIGLAGSFQSYLRARTAGDWRAGIIGTQGNLVGPNAPKVLYPQVAVYSWDAISQIDVSVDAGPSGTLAYTLDGRDALPNLRIGNRATSSNFFKGILYDVKIYDAITGGNLIHHWPLDDGGSIARDIVGGLNGTVVLGGGSWSKGLGPNIAPGTVSIVSNWTDNGDGSYTQNNDGVSGTIRFMNNDGLLQDNKWYQIDLTKTDAGALTIILGGVAVLGYNQTNVVGAGDHSIQLMCEDVATLDGMRIISSNGGETVSNLSVKEVLGVPSPSV